MPLIQFGIWMHEQTRPGTAGYNNAAAVRIRGPLDLAVLRAVLQEIQDRHAPLRSRYEDDDDGDCWAIVDPPGAREVAWQSLEAAGGPDGPECQALLCEHAVRPFDLAAGPVWRVLVIRLGPADHLLALTMHHIVSDGGSLGVLLYELGMLYTARTCGTAKPAALSHDYFSVVAMAEHDVSTRSLEYWRSQLADAPAARRLHGLSGSIGSIGPAADSAAGRSGRDDTGPGVVAVVVDAALAAAFRRQCVNRRTTVFAGLVAVFLSVLRPLSDSEDWVLTTPVDIRGRDGAALIGCFTNTVPLRIPVRLSDSLDNLLSHVGQALVSGLEHGTVPFPRIVSQLASGQRGGAMPFGELAVVDKNAPGAAGRFAGLDVSVHDLPARHIRHDLTLAVGRRGSDLVANFEYGAEVSRSVVAEIARRWHDTLSHLVQAGDPAWSATVSGRAEPYLAGSGDHG